MKLRQRQQIKHRAKHRALRLELLDRRVLLHGSGLGVSDPLPWFSPDDITYSFAPDGTEVAGYESSLFQELEPLGEERWRQQFSDALSAWLSALGVTAREVPDAGNPFGAPGPTQGDPRFGDVRIAAIPLSDSTLATSIPHSTMVQGSWAGDILINSSADWSSLADVLAVALHEFGHVLGLGHSSDPESAMFTHGLHDVMAPTPADIAALRKVYVGIRFEESNDPSSASNDDDHLTSTQPSQDDGRTGTAASPSLDMSNAIELTASAGSTIRYAGNGILSSDMPRLVYRLDPPSAEAKDAENMTVTLQSLGTSKLDVDITVYSEKGRRLESQVLHHGQGNVILQVQSVEAERVNYVVIEPTPSSVEETAAGDFEVVINIGPELQQTHELRQIQLDRESRTVALPISIASSRLVHLHLESEGKVDVRSAVFGWLRDSSGHVLTQIAMHPGTSRSASLALLEAGDYELILDSSTDRKEFEVQLKVRLDEVSIDVGPGVVDPTNQPYLACQEPGANPDFCYSYVPATVGPLVAPTDVPMPPQVDFPWWYGFGYSCFDYPVGAIDSVSITDPMWWEFYQQSCLVVPAPTGPTSFHPPLSIAPVDSAPVDPASDATASDVPAPAGPVSKTVTPLKPLASPLASPVAVSPRQNQLNSLDVSANHIVTAQDALIIVNKLAKRLGSQAGARDIGRQNYPDVNGDFLVSARDALIVINSLARPLADTQSAQKSPLATASPIHRVSSDLNLPIKDAVIAELF